MVHVYIIIVQPLLYSGCLNGLPQLEHHWGFEMEKTQAYTQVGECVWQKGRKATWKPICIGFIPFRESLNGMDDLGFQKSNTNKLQASNSTLFTSLWLHLAIDVVLSQIILALQCVHSDTFPSSIFLAVLFLELLYEVQVASPTSFLFIQQLYLTWFSFILYLWNYLL